MGGKAGGQVGGSRDESGSTGKSTDWRRTPAKDPTHAPYGEGASTALRRRRSRKAADLFAAAELLESAL